VDCTAQYGTLSQSQGDRRRRGMSEAQKAGRDGAAGQSAAQHRRRAGGGGNVPPVRACTQHTVRTVHHTVHAWVIRVCAPLSVSPPCASLCSDSPQRQRNRAHNTHREPRKEGGHPTTQHQLGTRR
jgi:hypothetical protein